MGRTVGHGFVVLFSCLVAPLSAQDWTQFRGPDGQGHVAGEQVPWTWSASEAIAWRTELPGKGWSSPVIEHGVIWVTTAESRAATPEEAQQRLANNTGSQPLDVAESVTFWVLAVDVDSGQILQRVRLFTADRPQPIHTLNSYASPTPVLSGGRLFCHFGTYGTCAVETQSGSVIWVNRDLKIQHENGPGSSPVPWRDLLIFHCDGSDQQFIVALRQADGTIAWKTQRSGTMNTNPQLKKAYGTPLIVDVEDQPLILSPAADWLYAYDPATGQERWRLSYETLGFSIVPRPVAGHGHLYMCTSFMRSQLLAIELDPHAPKISWRYTRQVPTMPSPLLVGDEIYFVSDKGIATCLDAHTGKQHWSERLGGNFAASPLSVGGRIYFFNREGQATVIRPGIRFEVLATNELPEGFMASPAVVPGGLILRTETALYRIGS